MEAKAQSACLRREYYCEKCHLFFNATKELVDNKGQYYCPYCGTKQKKIFNVEWELIKTGHSQHEAESEDELLKEEYEGNGLIEDFGNPDEFDENYDCDSGWKIKSIEEVK